MAVVDAGSFQQIKKTTRNIKFFTDVSASCRESEKNNCSKPRKTWIDHDIIIVGYDIIVKDNRT
jgi:hypothetical protein